MFHAFSSALFTTLPSSFGFLRSRMSDVYDAVEWMVEKGARIINMSLGGPTISETGQEIMTSAWNAGVLLIAAAGNDGMTDLHYPASFENVISVASVDENLARASFSEYNKAVDIAAPGVDILSTFPMNLGGAVLLSSPSGGAPGSLMQNSALPDSNLSGILVDCGLGKETCPGYENAKDGHICLIER